jgi:putative tricarboxylic transport membrane protein
MVACAVFILLAVLALWDTTSMTDSDSYVFPRTVALAMIVFCLAYMGWQLLWPKPPEAGTAPPGSTPRRVGLVLAMLGAAALMPWLGFVICGVVAFGSIMALAMYEAWTPRRLLVYALVGVAVVVGFYFLFAKLLLVPLPLGTLFE